MPNRICKLPDCGTEYPHAGGYGMCPKHYAKWKKYGDPYASAPPRSPRVVGVEPCTIAGCGDVQVARGWCSAHYTRWRRYGDPLHRFGWEVVGGAVLAVAIVRREVGQRLIYATPRAHPAAAHHLRAVGSSST